jgi:hypothetical protein
VWRRFGRGAAAGRRLHLVQLTALA